MNTSVHSNQNDDHKNIEEGSTPEILNLNDDCFREIFKYLTPYEMCGIKDTCVRLRELARSWMKNKSNKSNAISLEYKSKKSFEYKHQMKTFIKFSEFYPELIVDVNDVKKAEWIFNVLRKVNPKLESLTIVESDFQLSLQLREILENLKKIKLQYDKNYWIENYHYDTERREDVIAEILKLCTNVDGISFTDRWNSDPRRDYVGKFLLQKFEHLRSLEIAALKSLDLNNLKMFLRLNPNVQKVIIRRCCEQPSDLIFQKHSVDFEGVSLKLDYNAAKYSIHKLFQLDELKHLSFNAEGEFQVDNLLATIANMNSLISLSIANFRLDFNEGLFESLTYGNNLKILKLDIRFYKYQYFVSFRESLLRKLLNVEELHWILYDKCTAKTIKEIIVNCIKLKKLYLPFLQSEQNAVFSTFAYLQLVKMQSRKGVDWPLTIYLHNGTFDFAMALKPMLDALRKHSNVIQFAKYTYMDAERMCENW